MSKLKLMSFASLIRDSKHFLADNVRDGWRYFLMFLGFRVLGNGLEEIFYLEKVHFFGWIF